MKITGYRIVREIGRGGMSTVYLAVQQSLERQVALKVMSRGLAGDQAFKHRFLKEGRIVARLNHRNIVTIFDIGFDDSVYFIAMEYVVGRNLAERIREGLSPKQCINIVKRVARALNHAHRRGFIHRDIKPPNILFRDDKDAVLADFGIAKSLQDRTGLTLTGFAPGTPEYMSPEQLRGRPLDGRSDLYSLGVVFYEMLTRARLFEADSAIAVALRRVNEPPPELPAPLSSLQPIMSRLLAKEPSQRFSNAAELIKALDRATADRAIVAVRATGKTILEETTRFAPDATRAKDSQTRVAARATDKTILEPDTSFTVAEPATQFKQAPSIAVPEPGVSPSGSEKSRKNPWLWSMAVGGVAVAAGIAIYLEHDDGLRNLRDEIRQQIARDQQRPRVAEALDRAKTLFQANRFREPRGDNALEAYQNILSEHPGNQRAQQGLEAIARHIEESARTKLRSGKYEQALSDTNRALTKLPADGVLLALRTKIASAQEFHRKRARIAALLERAEQQIADGKYLKPRDDNFLETYETIRALDPGNAKINEGLQTAAAHFLTRAQGATNAGQTEQALTAAWDGLRFIPDDPALLDLQAEIHELQLEELERERRLTELLLTGQAPAVARPHVGPPTR